MAIRPRIPWHPLSLVVQLTNLRRVWPALDCAVQRGLLRATGWVTPSPLTQPYRIELKYRLDDDPKVWVREPRIVPERAANDPVPHVYDRTTEPRPCLFYPNEREWRSDKLLAMTVVPWLLVWLSFYEVWLATGRWMGEGVDHGSEKRSYA